MKIHDIPATPLAALRKGGVIPAHPLALDATRTLDPRRQRALSRYYLDAGAIGLAVGVHTTQFEIRDHGLLEPVLSLAAEEAARHMSEPFLVAGAVGKTGQAVAEAKLARAKGYHAVLLGLAAMKDAGEDELIAHCRAVAEVMPVIGFYLQPAVGGQVLPYRFWRRFAEIDNVVAIKMAPFNRYRTLDVVRAVVDAGAQDRITLYTGNDDHIVADLLTRFSFPRNGETVSVRIKGGLLGHWAVWTKRAVELLDDIHNREAARSPSQWLELDARTTDANGVLFDVANDFAGCIAAIHEVLRRQGLLEGIWCLNPDETMGPGQKAELDRIARDYPELNDDDFVRANLGRWLS
ncbi:dihydrodipicolinate synthase family protein [Chelativorans sp. ZYF759]|uniref:dihydrodipicolinate synthase family protein n=1 Tax=Chelativorans sp. ZYF759 TaxID=2692213 RepID=UPI00145CC3AC|nr:dihydrodipicolinate synthase family protein [Chelativorans sp. ZYF759]NMG39320.1 dihydrodipicolinate synthase family protein [Chelativorans sp. ZYF759]